MKRLLFIIALGYSVLLAQSIDKAIKTGYESIKATDLKEHLSVLASDSLEGRETTFPGQRKAANYIANHFRKIKLDAVGDSGTYFQRFDVEIIKVNPKTSIAIEQAGKKKNFFWKEDIIAEAAIDTVLSGTAVFVGFTDTELDSTSKTKLEGKIVFTFIGKKSYANDTTKAGVSRRFFSARRDLGASATLMMTDLDGPASFENAKKMISGFGLDNGVMKLPSGASRYGANYVKFLISPAIAEEALKNSGKTLKQIKDEALQDKPFSPLFLEGVKIRIVSIVDRELKQTENVVGLLEGSEPNFKTQAVVLSAHYDHVGKNDEGKIFYGANDNASGTSVLLELAEAFSINPIKPKRNILFIATTGEEKGLLGSQYYSNNPIIPLKQTIANLNMDMLGRIDTIYEATNDTNYIYVIGSNRISSELDSLLNVANKESNSIFLDYRFNGENDPERYYYRSDHFNFAKNGVPIVFFFDGINRDYHQPTDTVDKILFNRMEKVAKLIFNLGWKLANFERLLNKKHIWNK